MDKIYPQNSRSRMLLLPPTQDSLRKDKRDTSYITEMSRAVPAPSAFDSFLAFPLFGHIRCTSDGQGMSVI